MSAAARLREKLRETPKKKSKNERPKLFIDAKQEVRANHWGRSVSLGALGRYFRLLDRRRKELEAELNGVKSQLREAAKRGLDGASEYYDCAVVGPVRCVRQNRYQAIKGVDRGVLVNAVGELEFRSMFTERACLEFKDGLEMEQFISRCELAGVVLGGRKVAEIKPRSEIRRRMAELEGVLKPDVVALLDDLAKDTALAVGVDK